MKRFICTIVALMLVSLFVGCFATMTPEERKETYELRKSVGDKPFVGSPYVGVRDDWQSA
jgi:hypothetical protein